MNGSFPPGNTFWLFLSQVLEQEGSCREALRKFLAWLAAAEGKSASPNTAAYCKARKRLSMEAIVAVHRRLSRNVERAGAERLWCGRCVKVVDGSSVSMPDTPANQQRYPQPGGQKEGCGFPVMRIAALFSMATGAVLDVAKDALAVHERTLFRRLWHLLEVGDIVLADRGFASYADFYCLKQRGVDSVMRNHPRRSKGLTSRERLGRNDRLVDWHKTNVRPRWLDQTEWEAMPERLTVREINVRIETPGFRTKTLLIVTTLLDPNTYPPREIAELYRRRWAAELNLRDIKITMGMDILRCKTPAMIEKELWMHLIAYNLVRALMLDAALHCAAKPEGLSLKGTIVTIRHWAPIINQANENPKHAAALYERMLHYLATDLLPHRPNRSEPRAKKRRPKNYPLLNKPRHLYKEIPHRNNYTITKS